MMWLLADIGLKKIYAKKGEEVKVIREGDVFIVESVLTKERFSVRKEFLTKTNEPIKQVQEKKHPVSDRKR